MNTTIPAEWGEARLQSLEFATNDTRTALPRQVKGGIGMHDQLVKIAALCADRSKIGEHTAATTYGEVLA